MRWLVYPFGTHHRPAQDWLGHKVVGSCWHRVIFATA